MKAGQGNEKGGLKQRSPAFRGQNNYRHRESTRVPGLSIFVTIWLFLASDR